MPSVVMAEEVWIHAENLMLCVSCGLAGLRVRKRKYVAEGQSAGDGSGEAHENNA